MKSTPARIVSFALLLGAVFAGAAAIGFAVGPLERGKSDGHRGDAVAPAGLAVEQGGLSLVPERTTLPAGAPAPFSFRVVGAGGRALRSYEVEHERRMHLIVVRRDLTGFQHVHPVLEGATWSATLGPLVPGAHRAFADFRSGGEKAILGVDLLVPGSSTLRTLPAPSRQVTADGYTVVLGADRVRAGEKATLAFAVAHRGRLVAVERYLGARGHLVILREGDLGYLHVHAETDTLAFETTFPSAGRYRAFIEFRHGGAVHTAAFTLAVAG